mgnify:CR=1 FL=1
MDRTSLTKMEFSSERVETCNLSKLWNNELVPDATYADKIVANVVPEMFQNDRCTYRLCHVYMSYDI